MHTIGTMTLCNLNGKKNSTTYLNSCSSRYRLTLNVYQNQLQSWLSSLEGKLVLENLVNCIVPKLVGVMPLMLIKVLMMPRRLCAYQSLGILHAVNTNTRCRSKQRRRYTSRFSRRPWFPNCLEK